MSYEEEFDKIVRQKVSEADYPLDENDWSKASRILDAQRAASHRTFLKKLLLPAGFVIGIGTAGIIIFNSFGTSGVEKVTVESRTEARISAPEVANSPKESLATESSPVSESSPASEVISSESVSSKDVSSKEQSSPAAHRVTEQPAVSTPETVVLKNSEAATSAPNVNSTPNVNATKASAGEKKVESASQSNNGQMFASGTVEKPSGTTTAVEPVGIVPETTATEIQPNTSSDDKAAKTNVENSAPIQQDEVAEAVMSDYLASIALQEVKTENGELTLPFVWLSRYDDYFSKKRLTSFLNLEVGGTYLLGWTAPTGKDGAGLNWFGGFNFGYYLCPKTSIGIGVQVYNITNIRQPFYINKQKDYGFSYTSSYSSVTTDNLYYVSLPVKLSYHLNSSNHIGIGFNAGYLVQGHSRVDSYAASSEDRGMTLVESEGSNKIYEEGTAIINTMGSVFFSTKINPRFAINAEFIYGFTDLFKNAGSISTAEKPMGARLSINYYLFNK